MEKVPTRQREVVSEFTAGDMYFKHENITGTDYINAYNEDGELLGVLTYSIDEHDDDRVLKLGRLSSEAQPGMGVGTKIYSSALEYLLEQHPSIAEVKSDIAAPHAVKIACRVIPPGWTLEVNFYGHYYELHPEQVDEGIIQQIYERLKQSRDSATCILKKI